MNKNTALVLTTISTPNSVLSKFAFKCKRQNVNFIIVGDTSSPKNFQLKNCNYYDIERQLTTGFHTASFCPTKHYARKNIGYLLAIEQGAKIILETDDDNFPYDSFWSKKEITFNLPTIKNKNWVNIYKYFTERNIWPRGFPLSEIQSPIPPIDSINKEKIRCPIQQGMVNLNPDVDAIYRLIQTLPANFEKDEQIAIGNGSWCPFNSQNTTWWQEAFPLLYLPAYCSFRMTDIWRSFIAQRIAFENNWGILFHGATVSQKRNGHDLMRDFSDEIIGYLKNDQIKNELEKIKMKRGTQEIPDNLKKCYEKLIELKCTGENEIDLLECWLYDLRSLL